jgi:hypothetical protein
MIMSVKVEQEVIIQQPQLQKLPRQKVIEGKQQRQRQQEGTQYF